MPSLAQPRPSLFKTAQGLPGSAGAAVLFVPCALGMFQRSFGELGVVHAIWLCVWSAVFGVRAASRLRSEPESPSFRKDLELGLLLLTLVHALVQVTGGLSGQLYPLVYVLIAFATSFAVKPAGHILVLVAVLAEAVLFFGTETHASSQLYFAHTTFIVFFGLMSVLFTRAEMARVRETSKKELDQDKLRVREDARRYRLISAPRERAERDEERMARASVEELHQSVHYTLDLLARTLDLHTCALVLHDEQGEHVRVAEVVSRSSALWRGPIPAGEGVVGGVMKRGINMNLKHMRRGFRGLGYYDGPAPAQAFVGVPVIDNGVVRGALCADRLEDRPFSPHEEAIVEGAAHHVVRTIENERVFVQLERARSEQALLYQASQAMGAALSVDAVIEAALSHAGQIAPYDFAAVTVYDAAKKRHEVRRAVGEGAELLQDLSFPDNASLTAMAVKNRHYLPYRGEFDARRQMAYTGAESLLRMQSLLILPLFVREDPVGTLALAAQRHGVFHSLVRPTLQVLSNQLAVALANAESVRRLEQLATTDGLTGCLNKRSFLEELQKRLKVAERFEKPLSLIVTDIDHFKRVNDTYGHATGDVVIRGLGEILRGLARETDVVARFGGEEFCILCEETDAQGATQLAERVREELKARAFDTELGPLHVTCSLGVAEFPQDAKDDATLFESADKALYSAKQAGRDRVCAARRTPPRPTLGVEDRA